MRLSQSRGEILSGYPPSSQEENGTARVGEDKDCCQVIHSLRKYLSQTKHGVKKSELWLNGHITGVGRIRHAKGFP